MKICRKEFLHPAGQWSKSFWPWSHKHHTPTPDPQKGVWVAKTLTEVRDEFSNFVNSISPEKVVSINEYTTRKVTFGDDSVTHFVVWYWEDEDPVFTEGQVVS